MEPKQIQKNTRKGDFELLYDQKRKHYICPSANEAKIKPKIRARQTAHLMVKAAAAGSSVRVRRRADGGGQTSVLILHMAGTGRRRRRIRLWWRRRRASGDGDPESQDSKDQTKIAPG